MDSSSDESDGARRLAMDDIELALLVETEKRLTRARKPRRISSRQPWVVMGGVDVVPADAVSFLLEEALGVTSRDDLDVMPGDDKASRQRSGVILHSSDAVARDGDDANPHRSSMLVRLTSPRSRSRPREWPLRRYGVVHG